jgi:hypothetical protein
MKGKSAAVGSCLPACTQSTHVVDFAAIWPPLHVPMASSSAASLFTWVVDASKHGASYWRPCGRLATTTPSTASAAATAAPEGSVVFGTFCKGPDVSCHVSCVVEQPDDVTAGLAASAPYTLAIHCAASGGTTASGQRQHVALPMRLMDAGALAAHAGAAFESGGGPSRGVTGVGCGRTGGWRFWIAAWMRRWSLVPWEARKRTPWTAPPWTWRLSGSTRACTTRHGCAARTQTLLHNGMQPCSGTTTTW